MNVRQRITAILNGGCPDKVPWTFYPELVPRGSVEREIRDKGCGIVGEPFPYVEERPDVRVMREEMWDSNRKIVRDTYETPVGKVFEEKIADTEYYGSEMWYKKRMIKSLADYPVVEFIIKNTVYHPQYDLLLKLEEFLGDDGIVRAKVDYPPLQELLVCYMGIERFSFDIYDHRAEVEKLLRCLENKQDEMYRIAAEAPTRIVRCRSNISSALTPPVWFQKYLLPFYNKQASLLHKKGKLYGAHMDGNLKSLASLIAKTNLDMIEAFTPPPMGDLPLNEARRMWKDKIIWANFPSSVSWNTKEEISLYMRNLLREIAPGDKFILGITEDIPQKTWKKTLETIASVMDEYGSYPVSV
jgi:hypothetical protein